MRLAIDMLAAPLKGEARERFVADAEQRLNRAHPCPGREQKRTAFQVIE